MPKLVDSYSSCWPFGSYLVNFELFALSFYQLQDLIKLRADHFFCCFLFKVFYKVKPKTKIKPKSHQSNQNQNQTKKHKLLGKPLHVCIFLHAIEKLRGFCFLSKTKLKLCLGFFSFVFQRFYTSLYLVKNLKRAIF